MKGNFTIKTQKARNKAKRLISGFLDSDGFLEVQTPILSRYAIPEKSIHLFETERMTLSGNDKFYLLPSPELHMKRMLFEWKTSIYQFSECFRNSEQTSSEHCNEFTMLEYYKVGEDENGQALRTQKMFQTLFSAFGMEKETSAFAFRHMSMDEAVKNACGLNLKQLQDKTALRKAVEGLGISVWDEEESWADTFNRLFVSLVEPCLPCDDRPLVLYDYPIGIECLAEDKESDTAEKTCKRRWELYYKGMEIANCYFEMTGKENVARYLESEDSKIRKENPSFKSDFELASLYCPLPPSSGVALGFDRLMMILTNSKDIRDVLPFPEDFFSNAFC